MKTNSTNIKGSSINDVTAVEGGGQGLCDHSTERLCTNENDEERSKKFKTS